MSYQSQYQLENDPDFRGRSRSVAIQQANIFKDDARLNFVALAKGVLRDEGGYSLAFARTNAAAPGMADKVELPNGEIDQSQVTDGDLLSSTQASWPILAELYFNEDGTPIGG
jgi:hypothetical protein